MKKITPASEVFFKSFCLGLLIVAFIVGWLLFFSSCNDRGNKENTDRFYKQDTVKVDSVLVDSTQRPVGK